MKQKIFILMLAGVTLAGCSGGGGGNNGNNANIPPPAVNRAPTVTAIGGQNVKANQPSPAIAFTVTDEQPAQLTITARSSNAVVVADAGLVLGGGGRDRSLTITPIADTTGQTSITVDVVDGAGLTASTTFAATVSPEQKSLQQFVRTKFADDANADPEPVNAIEFAKDAEGDDFADLFNQ